MLEIKRVSWATEEQEADGQKAGHGMRCTDPVCFCRPGGCQLISLFLCIYLYERTGRSVGSGVVQPRWWCVFPVRETGEGIPI